HRARPAGAASLSYRAVRENAARSISDLNFERDSMPKTAELCAFLASQLLHLGLQLGRGTGGQGQPIRHLKLAHAQLPDCQLIDFEGLERCFVNGQTANSQASNRQRANGKCANGESTQRSSPKSNGTGSFLSPHGPPTSNMGMNLLRAGWLITPEPGVAN
ncbi:MAG TPA: hypothetical protein VK129_12840, partial [Terriglobales bacterium]|nr:hypothetical protein [Terriglobales bacterium]